MRETCFDTLLFEENPLPHNSVARNTMGGSEGCVCGGAGRGALLKRTWGMLGFAGDLGEDGGFLFVFLKGVVCRRKGGGSCGRC